jgi:cytoskeletal protein RodZ
MTNTDVRNRRDRAVGPRRTRRERERKLALRHRWFAGGTAALLASALIFSGISQATAETTPTPTQSDAAQPMPETTEVSAPVDVPAPETSATTSPSEAPSGPPADENTDSGEEESTSTDESVDDEDSALSSRVAPEQDTLKAADDAVVLLASPTSTDIVVAARTTAQPLGPTGNVGSSTVGVAGATYRLYTYTNSAAGPQNPVADAWATCTIASGANSCTINVPATNSGGTNAGKQFWVVQTSAGPSAYGTPMFRLGDPLGPTDNWYYPGVTQALAPNTTQNMPRSTTESSANGKSFGATANSLNNPVLPPSCVEGIKVALLMDLSSSVSADQRTQFRNAIVGANGLFDSLAGTSSSVAVFTFGTTSPADGTANFPTPLPLDTQRGTLESEIDITTNGTQYTNWDRGLRAVAAGNALHEYDMVLFITDGAPNYMTNAAGNGAAAVNATQVTVRSIEAAIYSANAIKAAGTQVLGIGVGNGVSGTVIQNLRAASGSQLNSDYFQTASWALLNQQLSNIATAATCQVPIRITKQILDSQGLNPTPDNGWTVGTAASAVSAGTATLSPNGATQVTGSGNNPVGTANWTLAFTTPGATATVTVSENAGSKPGYGFDSGSCTIFHAGGGSTSVTLTGTQQALTGIAASDRIECTYKNRPGAGQVAWNKVDAAGGFLGGSEWVLTGTTQAGVPVVPAVNVAVTDCVAASVAACVGPDKDPAAGKFLVKDLAAGWYALKETKAPTGYLLLTTTFGPVQVGSAIPNATFGNIANQLAPGQVTWNKVDGAGGFLAGSEWLLTGTTQAGVPVVPAVTVAVTDCVAVSAADCTGPDKDPAAGKFLVKDITAGWYTLKETKAPTGYVLVTTTFGPVQVSALAPNASYGNIANQAAPGDVTWTKVNDDGQRLSGSEWELKLTTQQGTPVGPPAVTVVVIDCTVAPCTGADKDPSAGGLRAEGLTAGWYTLTETKAPAGYVLLTTAIGPVQVGGAAQNATFGEVVNTQQAPVTLPLAGGSGSLPFIATGLAILFAGVIAAMLLLRRRRPTELTD